MSKVTGSLKEVFAACGIRDGMTLSFHHHLRNGDFVLSMVLEEAARQGLKGLCIQATSLFDTHHPLIDHIKSGVVADIQTGYLTGRLGRAISEGVMEKPLRFRTHGGRPDVILSGSVHIDVAFIAAPACDPMGNANGVSGPAACGSLGYAYADARMADKVVLVTDTILPYPLMPASIGEEWVDFVVKVDRIGDPAGIVSGTTRITRDPVGLVMAKYAAQVIEASGLIRDGFSFQTGAGGASLAVTQYLKPIMKRLGVTGSFGLGGITGYMVDMLEEGYFRTLMDVQCFDLRAVESIRKNPDHKEISAERYASPGAKSSAVESLDCVVLGATEMDVDFNVNVHTDSNGIIIGGSGGHADTAWGAKLCMIVAPLFRARLPIVVDRVTCVTTPGDTVDVLVTQRGVAVNPRRTELKDALRAARIPTFEIDELKNMAERVTGKPQVRRPAGRIVAEVEYRDRRIIDVIRCTKD